jgi:hypothetical protein
MITKWDNVQGTYVLEFYQDQDGRFLDVWEQHEVHAIVRKYLKRLSDDEHGELVIKFAASGYHDTGSMYGGADNLGWAPEGDEERIIIDVFIETESKTIKIDTDDWPILADDFQEGIYEVELDYQDN